MNEDRVNQIIEDAIEILSEETWCKGTEITRYRGVAKYCAIGAIKQAAGFQWESATWADTEDRDCFFEAERRCGQVVMGLEEAHCKCGCGDLIVSSIISYNDAVAESAEDVKLIMKWAIR